MLEHFVDEELPFAVRVARVDDRVGLLEKLADRRELLLGAALVFASISQRDGKIGRSSMRQTLRPFFVFGMSSGR